MPYSNSLLYERRASTHPHLSSRLCVAWLPSACGSRRMSRRHRGTFGLPYVPPCDTSAMGARCVGRIQERLTCHVPRGASAPATGIQQRASSPNYFAGGLPQRLGQQTCCVTISAAGGLPYARAARPRRPQRARQPPPTRRARPATRAVHQRSACARAFRGSRASQRQSWAARQAASGGARPPSSLLRVGALLSR